MTRDIDDPNTNGHPMDTAQAQIDSAPLPDARELRRRRNLVVQFAHFLTLNWRMYRLAKRHH
ncbi:MAG: hypothetical protein KKH51_10320 [Actinobacteria bacterium]|nr:hypothetical protein [Actinomycetota bacterium]